MQARDLTQPLLERVKFLAITATNLDEFYMVRLASLLRKQRAGFDGLSADGLDAQVRVVRGDAETMLDDLAQCWTGDLRPALAEHGIRFSNQPITRRTSRHSCSAISMRWNVRC
jgi:polyphosphate kinase